MKCTRLQDGLEHTWAVNVAAPFLLTGELLDLIAERIVNVSSISMADKLDFDTLPQVGWAPRVRAWFGGVGEQGWHMFLVGGKVFDVRAMHALA
jgi:hypothetical protein